MKIDRFDATFTTEDQTVAFRKVAMARTRQYRRKGWTLAVEAGAFTRLRLARTDGRAFTLKAVVYDIAFPLTNAAKIIVPDTGRHFMNTIYPRQVMFKEGGYVVSSAHMSTPFFVYLDGLERVTLAFGLMGKIIDTCFTQTSPAANAKFSLVVYDNECRWRIAKPYHDRATLGEMTAWEDGFYQREDERTWFHALRHYATLWQQEHKVKPKTNRAICKPELCTWRVVNSDRLTHDWTIRTGHGIVSVIHPAGAIESLPAAKALFLLKATAHETIFLRANAWRHGGMLHRYDYRHRLLGRQAWPGGDRIDIPAAGYAHLARD